MDKVLAYIHEGDTWEDQLDRLGAVLGRYDRTIYKHDIGTIAEQAMLVFHDALIQTLIPCPEGCE